MILNKEKTSKAFSRAASQYDRYAIWQQKIARKLVSAVAFYPSSVLDLGCGTGEISILLKNKFPEAEVHGIDIAPGMIAAAEMRSVYENKPDILFKVGDMEHIDYPAESFDLIVSNLSLQWLNDLSSCFSEVSRLLKPGGTFLFSTVLAGSQQELQEAYLKTFGDFPHRHVFKERAEICAALVMNNFVDIKYREITDTNYFGSFKELAASIKNVGAKAQNARVLTRTELKKLEGNYVRNKELLPLSYRILICQATSPQLSPSI
jgi:malonyl-CoA O-methyltransferase